MQHDVMISYSSKNEDLALKILDGLETAGIRCWISCRDVKLGQDYSTLIPPAIKSSCAVVFVLCGQFNNSTHARKEAGLASDDGKLMIPIRTEEFELSGGLSYFFTGVQHVNAFPDFDKALLRVIARIKEIMPTSSPKSQLSTAVVGSDQQLIKPDVQAVSAGGGSNPSVPQISDLTVKISRIENSPLSESSIKRYWFFNVGEDNKIGKRIWEDNLRFGFMSAGTEKRYRKAAQHLLPGDRVFAYLKGKGYVGFGEVTNSAVMIRDFLLPDGTPLLNCELTNKEKMKEFVNDYDCSEWAVGIRWRTTFPREAAVRYPEIFVCRRTICKFTDEKSLEFLLAKFS